MMAETREPLPMGDARPVDEKTVEQGPVVEDSASSVESLQDGVKGIEAISMSWSKTGLAIAYLGCVLPERANQLNQWLT